MTIDIFSSAAEMAEAIQARQVSSAEVLQAELVQIDKPRPSSFGGDARQ